MRVFLKKKQLKMSGYSLVFTLAFEKPWGKNSTRTPQKCVPPTAQFKNIGKLGKH